MNGSFWVFLPAALVLALFAAIGYRLRNGVKNEAPGPEGQRPYGTHGWLVFYILTAYYIAPLYALGKLNNDLSQAEAAYPVLTTLEGYASYKGGCWLLVLAAVAVGWRAAWLLKHRWVPSSVRFVKIVSLAGPILFSVGDAVLAAVTMDLSGLDGSAKAVITAVIPGLIWAAYFQFSKRVKNTYYPVKVDASAKSDHVPRGAEPVTSISPASAAPASTASAHLVAPLPHRPESLDGSAPPTVVGDRAPTSTMLSDKAAGHPSAPLEIQDSMWAAAWAELQEGRQHAATWARSFRQPMATKPRRGQLTFASACVKCMSSP